ncbi:unnamed protein product [Trichobilharzia szidati]|nr:unnamed protein product [Trichobilharzia szidati]
MKLDEISLNVTARPTSSGFCVLKCIIFTCIMLVTTIIFTLLFANIKVLRKLDFPFYVSTALISVGALPATVLFIEEKIEDFLLVNYMLVALSVLISSLGVAYLTRFLRLWSLLAWLLAMFLADVAMKVGYSLMQMTHKGDNITIILIVVFILLGCLLLLPAFYLDYRVPGFILFSVFVGLGLILALFLAGQGLKLCYKRNEITFLPVKLALIIWALTILLYVVISTAIEEIKNNQIRRFKNHRIYIRNNILLCAQTTI